MKKPINPQMVELGPFYQLCWLGLLMASFNLLWLLRDASISHGWPLAVGITGGALVTFLGVWRVLHARQKRGQRKRMARGVTAARPRLQHKLDALGDKLREFSGDGSARLILLPESAVVLSTSRSQREPVVEMTAGFLNTYSSSPRLIEAALAHEAGHIAARDVERFLRMLSLIRALVWVSPPVIALCGVLFRERGAEEVPIIAFMMAQTLVMAVGLALAWSALLVARELQADAFAVKVLGERRPLESLLERQLALRAAQAGRRTALQRLRTWLIQPDLRWRSTLPFLRGRLGARVEVKLGLSITAFIATVYWSGFIVTNGAALPHWIIIWGVFTWGAWLGYRFLWIRSRALGTREPGALSSGLMGFLCFCLPGVACTVAYMVCLYTLFGLPLWESTKEVLLLGTLLLAVASLLWAAGKVTLLSARERRRERPSILRAILALLGLLALGTTPVGNMLMMLGSPISDPSLDTFMLGWLPWLTVGLGAGMLAHHFSASAQGSGSHDGSALMKKPLGFQRVELGPFYQLCWLGFFTGFLSLLHVLWGMSNDHGRTFGFAVTWGALVTFLGVWRVLHARQKRGQRKRMTRGVTAARPRLQHKLVNTYSSGPRLIKAALAHEAGHIAARDAERFLRLRSLMRTLVWLSPPVIALCGAFLWVRGASPARGVALLLVHSLVMAVGLALAWSALLVARELQADAFAFLRGHLGARVQVKLGLAMTAFVSTAWWGGIRAWLAAPDSQDPIPGLYLDLLAWASWITYRFFWGRSRALGTREPGALSSGLTGLLYFCLPGLACFVEALVFQFIIPGQEPRHQLMQSTTGAVVALPTVAVLLWAAGKVTLLSARERRRAQPSIPRAVLSLLGLLVLGVVLLMMELLRYMMDIFLAGASVSPPLLQSVVLLMLPFLLGSLGAGILAHRLAASARTPGPQAQAPPGGTSSTDTAGHGAASIPALPSSAPAGGNR